MTLSDFITRHMEEILAEWEDFARTLGPAADTMDVAALRDHAQQMLTAIAADLRRPQSPAQQEAKSKGEAPSDATRTTAAVHHGSLRAERGFTIVQMISEYRALRASVLRLYARAHPADARAHSDDLGRFHEAIDQAVAESVQTFSNELDRSRDLFLGIIGHDLRNPIGAILRSAGDLLDTEEPAGPCFRAASRILDSARRMRVIAGDFLDLTRIRLGPGGGIPIAPAQTDLARLARQIVDEAASAHPGHEVRLEARGNTRGRWDPGRLGQALGNLLQNAIRYGSAEAPITVTVRADPDEVAIDVHNHGPMIPEDRRDDLFQPMRRLSATTSTHPAEASLGLGLYIAREIAIAHGGDISVESSDLEGTTFTLRLPVKPGSSTLPGTRDGLGT